MKNLTDFMVDITKNEEMGKELMTKLNASDHSDLTKWFKTKGYEVNEAECKKLVANKEQIKNSRVGLY